jgi:hypothetical protein
MLAFTGTNDKGCNTIYTVLRSGRTRIILKNITMRQIASYIKAMQKYGEPSLTIQHDFDDLTKVVALEWYAINVRFVVMEFSNGSYQLRIWRH